MLSGMSGKLLIKLCTDPLCLYMAADQLLFLKNSFATHMIYASKIQIDFSDLLHHLFRGNHCFQSRTNRVRQTGKPSDQEVLQEPNTV